jgi:hypothetical protein
MCPLHGHSFSTSCYMDLKKIPKKSEAELLNSLLREINLQLRKAQDTQDFYHLRKMKLLSMKINEILNNIRPTKG